jgi:hypothetical protein
VTAHQPHPDTTGTAASAHDDIPHYEIRVKGRLAPRWSAWFDGLTIDTEASDGTTTIRGPSVDQAALHGLLQKLRDVGVPLVSLAEVPSNTTEPHAHPHPQEN